MDGLSFSVSFINRAVLEKPHLLLSVLLLMRLLQDKSAVFRFRSHVPRRLFTGRESY